MDRALAVVIFAALLFCIIAGLIPTGREEASLKTEQVDWSDGWQTEQGLQPSFPCVLTFDDDVVILHKRLPEQLPHHPTIVVSTTASARETMVTAVFPRLRLRLASAIVGSDRRPVTRRTLRLPPLPSV